MVNGVNLERLPRFDDLRFQTFIRGDHTVVLAIEGCSSADGAKKIAEWVQRSLTAHSSEIGFLAPELDRRIIK